MGSKLEELLKASQAPYKYVVCDKLPYQQGFLGERFGCKNFSPLPTPVAPTHDQKLQPRFLLPIMCFGKMHYISLEVFQRDAAKYNQLQWKDAWILIDSVSTNWKIYLEWIHPARFFDWTTAKTVEKFKGFKDWCRGIDKAPKPDPAKFLELHQKLLAVADKVRQNAGSLDAAKMVAHGVEIDQVRENFKRLMKAVDAFRNKSIEAAEEIEAGLETVEGAAFEILNVVPTLTLMDPFREAAYKIGVLLVRAAARGVGGALAWGTLDGAIREAFGILRREAVPLIVGIIMIPVNRLALARRWGSIQRHIVTNIVQQELELVCAIFKIVVDSGGKRITPQQWRDLLLDRVAALVSGMVGLIVPTNLGDKALKTLVKSITESAVSTLILDYENALKVALKTNRTVAEVMQADLPGIIMRFIQNTIVGVFQRRAQQVGQNLEQERVTRGADGTTRAERRKILEETEAGEFFRKGKAKRATIKEIQEARRGPVGAFSEREYNAYWKQAHLDYATAQGLRRYSDNNNLVVIAVDPNQSRIRHTSSPEERGAKAPKPVVLSAKTSDNPGAPASVYGLVAKPARVPPNGPTHSDYRAAVKKWLEDIRGAYKQGYMVRPDGVVFHPDQLTRWAQMHPNDAAACNAAIETLNALRKNGKHDLMQEIAPAQSGPTSAARLAATKELLARVKVGFYSDLDLHEVVDFATGQRRFMGDKDEKERVFDLARDNRQHANRNLNIKDYIEAPLGYAKESPIARRGDALQHGGEAEVVTISKKQVTGVNKELDRVNMVFPHGEVVLINEAVLRTKWGKNYDGLDAATKKTRLDSDLRQAIEEELKLRLGVNYQEFMNRATRVRKDYSKVTSRYSAKSGTPPPVTIQQYSAIQRSLQGVEIIDEKGLGRPVDVLDVRRGFDRRKLVTDVWAVARAIGKEAEANVGMQGKMDAQEVWDQYGVLVGADEDGLNIVFAVLHYEKTMAHVIASLLMARKAFAIRSRSKVWYEIYTAYRPVASGYVRDRIGGPDPGVDIWVAGLGKFASCFGSPKNEKFHAFATSGFVRTYTPTYGKEPPKNVLHTQGGTISTTDPNFVWEDNRGRRWPKDPRPVEGLLLTDVWANQQTMGLSYRPTKTAEGSRLVVFPDVIVCASLFGD
jgi:hypothetical protein